MANIVLWMSFVKKDHRSCEAPGFYFINKNHFQEFGNSVCYFAKRKINNINYDSLFTTKESVRQRRKSIPRVINLNCTLYQRNQKQNENKSKTHKNQ